MILKRKRQAIMRFTDTFHCKVAISPCDLILEIHHVLLISGLVKYLGFSFRAHALILIASM